ncbi:uncharacterized protein UV8b_08264 [Ustilaginoidea virens]|uniref:ARS binding protein 2 n=1 Tax=Ustilaginoidea virens TaxID=1159556 RepID=A0A8E5HZ68_USTVR|nr:uncharacterized protein UV8b_08264 [Ustilaginoidea virens]QUC24023.1 hypothetical protein UV8b_08264 [Ustilaginoidea virens]
MDRQTTNGGLAMQSSAPGRYLFRPTLPDRRVTAPTIEDAYVHFILYCNPAIDVSSDTTLLREGFRTPPRSGGKVFDTFTIFELVRRFYNREIKTWTELTTTLGVEPPDPSRDESAQKIAQYGVRLKKWMNSMHVKAFFEYLIGVPNEYWTSIPKDPNPIAWAVRDGVAVEDDMALRALLPEIRPKRGRKRPEGDDAAAVSPAQRQRLSPPSALDEHRQARLSEPWSARADGGNNMDMGSSKTCGPHAAWTGNEPGQTPVSRWSQSAATPTTRGSFWDDALQPQPAATPPSTAKTSGHRRGAKNVSSAWKTVGQDPGTRPRGRPPIANRAPANGPDQHLQQPWTPTVETPGKSSFSLPPPTLPPPPLPQSPHGHANGNQQPPPQQHLDQHFQHAYHQHISNGYGASADMNHTADPGPQMAYDAPRPATGARPSVSLQVPEPVGDPVRLATPPAPAPSSQLPPGQAKGAEAAGQYHPGDVDSKYQDGWRKFAKEATDAYEQGGGQSSGAKDSTLDDEDGELEDYYFEKMEDRTNVDVLVAYFTRSMVEADWRDVNGQPTKTVGLEESMAMVHAMLQTMHKTSTSPQAFLINLAALAGSTNLVTNRPKCTRLSEQDGQFTYKCEWEYRFGQVKGGFTFEQVVPASMWSRAKRKQPCPAPPPTANPVSADVESKQDDDLFSKEYWQKKYEALTIAMEDRDKHLTRLRDRVMSAIGRDFA